MRYNDSREIYIQQQTNNSQTEPTVATKQFSFETKTNYIKKNKSQLSNSALNTKMIKFKINSLRRPDILLDFHTEPNDTVRSAIKRIKVVCNTNKEITLLSGHPPRPILTRNIDDPKYRVKDVKQMRDNAIITIQIDNEVIDLTEEGEDNTEEELSDNRYYNRYKNVPRRQSTKDARNIIKEEVGILNEIESTKRKRY